MKRLWDVRHLPAKSLPDLAGKLNDESGLLLTAWQWRWLQNRKAVPRAASKNWMAAVPDFLHYARLISTGQAPKVLALPGSAASVLASAVRCCPAGIRNLPGILKTDFWTAAELMTRYDLALLGSDFQGQALLHHHLADFACFFERRDFLRNFMKTAGERLQPGLMTQQLPKTASCCARWNLSPGCIIYLDAPSGKFSAMTHYLSESPSLAHTRWWIDASAWPASGSQSEMLEGLSASIEGIVSIPRN